MKSFELHRDILIQIQKNMGKIAGNHDDTNEKHLANAGESTLVLSRP